MRGLARVKPYNPGSDGLARCREVWLRRRSDECAARFAVRERRPHGSVFLLALEGIDSLNALEPWRGSEVSLDPATLPQLRDDEVYHYEVIGLEVKTCDGADVGVVRRVLPLPGNDVWVVEATNDAGAREVLIPVVGAIVKEIDLARGVALVDPPPGLLEG